MTEIDARGLSCPAPVLQAKAALEGDRPPELNVTVDNAAAKENVSRFLSSQGYAVEAEESGGEYVVRGRYASAGPLPSAPVEPETAAGKKIMVMVATDRFGFGDDELGRKLMVNFIKTLKEMGPDLWRLVLVNNGVKLAVTGSGILPDLKEYAENGLTILVCGTCLTHFDLLDQKEVGETTNMLDIVTAMQVADKVINL